MLTSLGLTLAEQDLYRYLVRRPPAGLAELTAGHGAAVVSIVDRLVALGLLVRLAGPPERVAVVPPRLALEPLYHARARDLAEIRRQSAVQAKRGDEEPTRHTRQPPVERLRGVDAVLRATKAIELSVRKTFRFWDAAPYLRDPAPLALTDDPILKRGVTIRIVYEPQAVNIPGRPAALIRESVHDLHARVAELPMKLALADRSFGMVLRVADGEPDAALVREPTLVAALVALFETYWEHGVPLAAYPVDASPTNADPVTPSQVAADGGGQDAPGPPDAADRELLMLLGAGLVDREIAEHLGRSERTVRNRIQRVKNRLGAQTRYQAGYLAARYGWIATDRRPGDRGGSDAA